ncbi:MAG: hypothetical protein CMH52_05140 [Myxococcales bacterium]|nr:hypothetical protein [Myxococcales bacterium]
MRFALTGLLCLLFSCSAKDETIDHRVQFDLTPCLGSMESTAASDETICGRGKVSAAMPSDEGANGCLLAQFGTGETQFQLIRWAENRLIRVGEKTILYETNSNLNIQITLFNRLVDEDTCRQHGIGSRCEGQCVVQLVSQTPPSSGRLVSINFIRSNGTDVTCGIVWNEDSHPVLKERCDGLDNNCDGEVDELEQCCTRNADCQSDLSDMFCDEVTRECAGCQSHSDCSNKFETRIFCDPESGRCGECDPEPGGDLKHRCSPEQPRCIRDDDGRTECTFCDPEAALDSNGCPYKRPCFAPLDASDAPYCARCFQNDDCPDSLECLRLIAETDPLNGSCQECSPVLSGQSPACVLRGDNHYCSPLGRCVECLPEVQDDACPQEAPYCLENMDGSYFCQACTTDLDCRQSLSTGAYCDPISKRCLTCRPGTRDGCSGATPVCDRATAQCRACESTDECESGVCRIEPSDIDCSQVDNSTNADCLRLGQCTDCSDGSDGLSCNEAERPICDNETCIGCRENADCPVETPVCNGLGQCTECPNLTTRLAYDNMDATLYTCAENGESPICSDDGICLPCTIDRECQDRPGQHDVCVDGRCQDCRLDDGDSGCTDPTRPVCNPNGLECVQCISDTDCADDMTCNQFICEGGCNPNTQTGCPSSAPVCTADGECVPCRRQDCDPRLVDAVLIAQRCATSASCVSCIEPDVPSAVREPPMEGQDDRPNNDDPQGQANGQVYGCDLTSNAPVCLLGQCIECRVDRDCGSVPGAQPVCAPDGSCVRCVSDEIDQEPDRGCTAERPFCQQSNGSSVCGECSNNAHCDDGVCYASRCQECNGDTQEGCLPERPICRAINGRARCEGCRENAECRKLDCRADRIDECVSVAVCDPLFNVCKQCTDSGLCADGRPCRDGRCFSCRDDAECARFDGFRCNRETGACVGPNCRSSEDCQQYFTCQDEICSPCRLNQLCDDGRVCVQLERVGIMPECLFCDTFPGTRCPEGYGCSNTGRCERLRP